MDIKNQLAFEQKDSIALHLAKCGRCGQMEVLNDYALCEHCNEHVDQELKLLYTDNSMDH